MCGICGVRRFSDVPLQRDMIDLLILNNENRGLEATGIALQQPNGSVAVFKDDVPAHEFIISPEYEAFMETNLKDDTVIAIGHCRKVTKGTPRNNGNNHPMWDGKTAVVHNGVIHNDDDKFRDWKLERKAETDSDIFRALLDREGFTRKAVNLMSQLSGSGAFAAVSTEHPGKLLLGRSGNPIEFLGNKDVLMFSSESGPLYKAVRPWKSFFGIVMREIRPEPYGMIKMNDHSAWLLSDKPKDRNDWVEWHQEMRIANDFSPRIYNCHDDYRGNRVRFYDDRPVDVVQCQNCKLYMDVPSVLAADLKNFKCRACKAVLGG